MINLENFINLCNLEGTFCFTSVEEKENCFYLLLTNAPNGGQYLNNIEHLYNKKVKNVNFDCSQEKIRILIEVE